MDLKQIQELMKSVEESKLTKFVLKQKDFELHLEKQTALTPAVHSPAPAPAQHHVVVEPKVSHAVTQPGNFVKSPMVGTFYASPSPDQPAFVKVGDKVTEHTVVCIVEAMKVMNEVKAGLAGTVAEILTHNGDAVEFGTKLFRIV
jgi:acetyl-CoA carboxylase biotin carboxyl carrier protein